MHKIFIVEDNEIIRQAYTDLIEREPDLKTCGTASSTTEALKKIPRVDPDLVIVDISLDGTNGIELVEALQNRQPQLLILVISGYDESFYAQKAIQAGARGYVTKVKVRNITTAIRQVLNGGYYFSDQVLENLGEDIPPLDN